MGIVKEVAVEQHATVMLFDDTNFYIGSATGDILV